MTPVHAQAIYGATGGQGDSTGGAGGSAGQAGDAGTGTSPGSGGLAGNSGSPDGGNGGNGIDGGGGGGGGGYSAIISGNITTSITGGNGGNGGSSSGGGGDGGGGGGGGDGVRNTDLNPEISVTADVHGGNGGLVNAFGIGGNGGGGAGIVLQNNGSITVESSTTIGGGDGGNSPVGGGGGGAGVILNAGGSVTNHGDVQGGAGGEAAAGGAGVVIGALGNITNYGRIIGGLGGLYAASGAGIDLKAGGTIVNSGEIVGGQGNAGSSGGVNTPNGGTGSGGAPGTIAFQSSRGDGGTGIIGANVSIINSGAIAGGANNYFGQANAITFTGGTNRLELQSGSRITGKIAANGDDTLALGGNISPTDAFDVSKIVTTATTGATDEYAGFEHFQKTGTSTWTLTGTGAQDWAIEDGALQGDANSLGGNIAFSGAGASTRGVIFNQASNGTYAGTISGDGSLTKAGAGTLTLNGINTYTRDTTVQAGTLAIGDASHPEARVAGNVQVDAQGTLKGHGTVGGNVINNGLVWPGGSIGTLTIDGNYNQAPSATLKIDVSPTVASLLRVGGTANLDGSLEVLYGPGTYSPKQYTIVSANQVSGQFAQSSGNTPSGFAQSLSYGTQAVTLNLASMVTDPVIGLEPVIVPPQNATIFGDLGSAMLRAGQFTNEMLLNRLDGVCTTASDTRCLNPGQHLWIQAGSTFTHVDGNRGAPNVRDDRYGFMTGADRAVGAWTLGVAGGYSHGNVRQSSEDASGKIDTLRLATYGGRHLGPINMAGTASYAYNFVSTRRGFGAFGHTHDQSHAQEFNAGLQASLPWEFGAFTLAPRLGVRYAYMNGLSVDESGLASQRLSAEKQNLHSLQPYVGLTLDYAFTPHNTDRQAHAQLRVGYAYETQSTDRDVTVASGDGTNFIIPGTRDSRGLATAGLSLDLPLAKATRVYARYDAILPTGNLTEQSVQLGINYRF